jgi:hypothetical protein
VCNFANWSFHENVIICQNKNRRKKVSFKSSLKFLFSHKSKFLLVTGGDVMITIFCEFGQFSAKKFAFFSKPMLWSNFFQNLALFWVKNANFFVKFFGENILNIITSVPGRHLNRRDSRINYRGHGLLWSQFSRVSQKKSKK